MVQIDKQSLRVDEANVDHGVLNTVDGSGWTIESQQLVYVDVIKHDYLIEYKDPELSWVHVGHAVVDTLVILLDVLWHYPDSLKFKLSIGRLI